MDEAERSADVERAAVDEAEKSTGVERGAADEERALDRVACRRCPANPGPALERAPFRSELGERIRREVCARCWRDWLQHQTLLINHFGLNPREREAKEFLYGQVRAVLFGEGEVAEIDTSRQGTIGPPGERPGR